MLVIYRASGEVLRVPVASPLSECASLDGAVGSFHAKSAALAQQIRAGAPVTKAGENNNSIFINDPDAEGGTSSAAEQKESEGGGHKLLPPVDTASAFVRKSASHTACSILLRSSDESSGSSGEGRVVH